MPPFAILMRCLLLVALCLDLGVSQWAASAMAVSQAKHAADSNSLAAAASGEDCDEELAAGQPAAHEQGCECELGSMCCTGALPAATIAQEVPFSARHLLAERPELRAELPPVLTSRTRVFRPPIG